LYDENIRLFTKSVRLELRLSDRKSGIYGTILQKKWQYWNSTIW